MEITSIVTQRWKKEIAEPLDATTMKSPAQVMRDKYDILRHQAKEYVKESERGNEGDSYYLGLLRKFIMES
jgi:hypothetical protein